jgi:hypothetical protein
MAVYTENFSEVHQVLAHEPADSQTVEVNSGYVDAARVARPYHLPRPQPSLRKRVAIAMT